MKETTFFKKLQLLALSVVFFSGMSMHAQSTGTQTFTTLGIDANNDQLIIDIGDVTVNEGMPLLGASIVGFEGLYNSSIGSDGCETASQYGYSWFDFDLSITGGDADGTALTGVCADSIIGIDVDGFTNITVTMNDKDNWPDQVYVSLTLEVTYDTPSCAMPTNLNSSNPGISTIDLSWTGAGGETGEYELKWGEVGFDIDNTTAIAVTGQSYTLNAAGGSYEFVVRELCGAEESVWAPRQEIYIPQLGEDCSAPIQILSLPYTTQDDTANYTDNPSIEGSPGSNGCSTTSSYLNGNDVIYAYTAENDGSINVELANLTDTYAGIFAYADCADIGVTCIGGATYNFMDGITDLVFELDVVEGETYYFVISTWASPQTVGYTLNVTELLCGTPTNLASENATPASIDLTWIGIGGDAGEYELKWGEPGFVIDDATAIEVTGQSYQLNVTGGNYEFVVRENCSAGVGEWSARQSFYIPQNGDDCSAPIEIATLPYTTQDDTANYTDNPNIEGSPGNSGCGTTSSYLNGNDVVYAYIAEFDGDIMVVLSEITESYAGIFAYADCADIGTECIGGANYNFQDGIVDLSFELSVVEGETYYFVISTWATPQTVGYTLNITELTCPRLTGVENSGITSSTATFTWDESADTESYTWYVFADNADVNTDTPLQTGTVIENSVTVDNLDEVTNYDFYVQADCGATDGESMLSVRVDFITSVQPIIVSADNPVLNETFCYSGNEFKQWIFEAENGEEMTISFIAGSLEEDTWFGGTYDDLLIYDGSDDTGVLLFNSDYDGANLAGLSFTATSGYIYMVLIADGSFSCSDSDSINALDFDVTIAEDPCADVTAPEMDSPYELEEGQTLADIEVTEESLTWYTDADLTEEADMTAELTEGQYTYYVTQAVDDCVSEATEVVVNVEPLGLSEFDSSQLKVYPNPSKDVINISYSEVINQIEVYNLLGQKVSSQAFDSKNVILDITNLSNGTYMLILHANEVKQQVKIVKY